MTTSTPQKYVLRPCDMSSAPKHPVFHRGTPTMSNYRCTSPPRPPILKRMPVPQKTWQPRQVIRRVKDASDPPLSRVTFDLVGAQPAYGVPIALLTSQGCNNSVPSMVQNAEDPIFEGTDKLTFRVLWPGYEHVNWHRYVNLTTHKGQLTRGQLAEQIIDCLFAFFNRLNSESVNPTKKVWMVGHNPGQWSMENIILLGLYPVGGSTFQAELQLCFPHQARVDEVVRDEVCDLFDGSGILASRSSGAER